MRLFVNQLREYMLLHFSVGNLIFTKLEISTQLRVGIFFVSNILRVKLQAIDSIYWIAFLFFISFNTLADYEIKHVQQNNVEGSEATSETELRSSKPVIFTRASAPTLMQESEAMNETELRSNEPIVFANKSAMTLKIERGQIIKTADDENKHEREAETKEGENLRSGHQMAFNRPLLPILKVENESGLLITKIEESKKPIFMEAELLQGHNEMEIEGIGRAEMRSGDYIITAERMKYFQNTDDTEVEGDVRIEQNGDVLEGSRLKLNMESKIGRMDKPRYHLKDDTSHGSADTVLLEGEGRYRFSKGSYTTCPEGNEEWAIKAEDLKMNNNVKEGSGRGAKLMFGDVPVFYTPWLNFSYSGERKSGFLAPTYSTNVKTGLDLFVPFYWNIAPNIDATFALRGMSRRGVMSSNEFRYMTKDMRGLLLFDYLPNDIETHNPRSRIQFTHNQQLGKGWSTNFDFNRVSDNAYFRELGNGLYSTSNTNLLQMGSVAYNSSLGPDGSVAFRAMAQQFQTLQDPVIKIVEPYKRLPSVTLSANQYNVLGADLNFKGSWDNYSHDTLVGGNRMMLAPSMSIPLQNKFGYFTPKIGINYTSYSLQNQGSASDKNPTRTLPTFSLDSGTTFDREITIMGSKFMQTIEPRAYYTYTPFRDQRLLPNFDSGEMDFSFTRLFTENRFSGSDRINDANRAAAALTSRFIDSATGKERFRISIGQLANFSESRTVLTSAQGGASRKPDLIAGFGGQITPVLAIDASAQIDQSKMRAEIVRTSISYRPEIGKVLNLGFRVTREVIRQVDISGQWPLSERWHGVGRLNYSLMDSKILEGLLGLEYNACCWSARLVFQRITTATQTAMTAAFLQVELNGILQAGSDPLQAIQRSVPGYTRMSGNPDSQQEELRGNNILGLSR